LAVSINNMKPFDYAEYRKGLNYKVLQENLRNSLNASVSVRDLNIPAEDTRDTLEAVINNLEEKKDKTGMEETLLDASKAVMEESQYMDGKTLQEFEQAVNTLLIAESVKDEMGEGGFKVLEDALAGIVIEQKALYDNYLKETETAYIRISEVLGIDPDKDELPDNYALIYNLNIRAKRKILTDISLEQIRARDKATLAEREKEALKIESDYNLLSKRGLYLDALNRMVSNFISFVRHSLEDKRPNDLLINQDSMKALFRVDDKSVNSREFFPN